MAIQAYNQEMHVDTASSLPMNATSGTIAFAQDTLRHYMFSSGIWYIVPSLPEVNAKTAVRFWDSGTFLNGTPNTGDMIIFTDSTTVAGGTGDATFYLTSNHLSTGAALCSSILQNSCRGGWVDPSGNYNPGAVTITGNKTVGINGSKQGNTGVTLLGIGVLTAVTFPNQPNGTTVTFFGIGISV